jgi:hypothetical protein
MYHAKQVIYAKIENDILKIRDIRRERAYLQEMKNRKFPFQEK